MGTPGAMGGVTGAASAREHAGRRTPYPVPTVVSAPQIASSRPSLAAAAVASITPVARWQDQGAVHEHASVFCQSRTLAGKRLPPGGAA
jgi:hypothetical protein